MVGRFNKQERLLNGAFELLRREGSNLRPSGYEPDELPLLYFAMWNAKVRRYTIGSKLYLSCTHEGRIR